MERFFFVGNKMNVAIPLVQDLYEPPVYGSMLHYETIYENYKYLKLSRGMLMDLDPIGEKDI